MLQRNTTERVSTSEPTKFAARLSEKLLFRLINPRKHEFHVKNWILDKRSEKKSFMSEANPFFFLFSKIKFIRSLLKIAPKN